MAKSWGVAWGNAWRVSWGYELVNYPNEQWNCFLRFPNQLAAQNNPITGPLLPTGLFPLTVYDLAINSVTPLPGFWCAIVQDYPIDPVVVFQPEVQFVLNYYRLNATGSSVIINNLDPSSLLSDLEIVVRASYALQRLH